MARSSKPDSRKTFILYKIKIGAMQTSQPAAATNISIVDSSLADFYNVIAKLSKVPFVRFTGKEDEADCIDWSFTYRKRKFTLQYSIYNGISLFSNEEKIEKLIQKLVTKLRLNLK